MHKKEGYMHLFPATKPFQIVHMDIVGPLPITRKGNRYILTMMDRFSRMIKLIPLPTITASCIAMAFRNHWLLNYGTPENVLTDRGTYFAGLIFGILRDLHGFKSLFTTSYHPRTNGRLERFHRYLKERLRILAAERNLDYFSSDDWDIYIPNIQYSYNVTPNRMTKYSPYNIIYGDVVNLPIDRILKTNMEEIVDKNTNNFQTPTDWRSRSIKLSAEHRNFIAAAAKHREHLMKEIQATSKQYEESMKRAYDRSRESPTHYPPGQVIYVDFAVGTVGNRRKMAINRKRGVIIDKISSNAYVVAYDDGKIEPVNVDRLYTIRTIKKSPKPKTKTDKRFIKTRFQKSFSFDLGLTALHENTFFHY